GRPVRAAEGGGGDPRPGPPALPGRGVPPLRRGSGRRGAVRHAARPAPAGRLPCDRGGQPGAEGALRPRRPAARRGDRTGRRPGRRLVRGPRRAAHPSGGGAGRPGRRPGRPRPPAGRPDRRRAAARLRWRPAGARDGRPGPDRTAGLLRDARQRPAQRRSGAARRLGEPRRRPPAALPPGAGRRAPRRRQRRLPPPAPRRAAVPIAVGTAIAGWALAGLPLFALGNSQDVAERFAADQVLRTPIVRDAHTGLGEPVRERLEEAPGVSATVGLRELWAHAAPAGSGGPGGGGTPEVTRATVVTGQAGALLDLGEVSGDLASVDAGRGVALGAEYARRAGIGLRDEVEVRTAGASRPTPLPVAALFERDAGGGEGLVVSSEALSDAPRGWYDYVLVGEEE